MAESVPMSYSFKEKNKMRLTKGQLKRIIREEYSRLKRRGLISEMGSRGQFSRGSEINKFHRGGNRAGHDEFRRICGDDPDVMGCFDYVWNSMKLGESTTQCASGLQGQPWMVEWDEMMSCLAECSDSTCQKLLEYCLDVDNYI